MINGIVRNKTPTFDDLVTMKDAMKFGTTTVDAVIALAALDLLLLPHWGHLCTFMHNEFPQSAHKPASSQEIICCRRGREALLLL